MGFSDWSFGTTEAHQAKTYELIWENSDLICLQFNDGIPWREAYEKKPYGKALQTLIAGRLNSLKKGHKVYLEISPLNMGRDGIAVYNNEEASMPMPPPWDTYAIDDPHMITGYANFCLSVIELFNPAYVNYALEGTSYLFNHKEQREPYLRFLQGVYDQIKSAHPDVPLGISAVINDPYESSTDDFRQTIAKLNSCMDWLGASFYPFAFFPREDRGNPNTLPKPSLELIAELAQGKPVAITETNWPAENLVIDAYKLNCPSTPEWQKDYADFLLQTAQNLNALFVIWWSVADYDIKWEAFPDNVKDIGKVWRDTGLYDEKLEPRPALAVWKAWFSRPLKRAEPPENKPASAQ